MAVMVLAGIMGTTSCSDFDDYNTARTDVTDSANKTLWENISTNKQLSQLAAIIKKSGFDKELSASHYYTVWAPLDGTYDAEALLSKDSIALRQQLVKNHIANYGHGASGTLDERVHMLNEKGYDFKGSGSYTFNGIALKQANLPCVNGLLHTINGQVPFRYNLYEYISKGEGLDSLHQYFMRYETRVLDTKNSVLGPMVNGKQTYIDSVIIVNNSLAKRLNAKLENEDSTYTMLLPTNEAWKSEYEAVRPYYTYFNKSGSLMQYQEFDNEKKTVRVQSAKAFDAGYLSDSLTHINLVRWLIFNNNTHYNRFLVDATSTERDTLLSTTGIPFSHPADILASVIETIPMSNGVGRMMTRYGFHSWESYAPQLSINAYRNKARTLNDDGTPLHVTDSPYKMKNGTREETLDYIWLKPASSRAKPELDILLPNVLSAEYNIYLVVVPGILPNRLRVMLNYCDANGNLKDKVLNTTSFVQNDISKVDTIFLSSFKFPIAYRGMGDKVAPNIKISSPWSVTSNNLRKYARDLRIAAIILKPVEQDAYEGRNH